MASLLDEQTQFMDTGGRPLVNGFLYIGDQNADPVLNLKPIFSDRELTIPLANPQTLDGQGRTVNKIWVDGRYSMKVEDVNNVQQYQELDNGQGEATGITTLDNVQGANQITATATVTITEYVDKEQYVFTAAQVNTTDVDLNIDNVGFKSVLKNTDEELDPGDFDEDQVVIVVYNGVHDHFEWVNQKTPEQQLTRTHLDGLTVTSGTDTEHDRDISIGSARDDTNLSDIVLASVLTKKIDEPWAVGTDMGGLDTGTVAADTWYHIWLILRTDTGVVDALYSTSATAPTMPANYDRKRRIRGVLTDASANILEDRQNGNTVMLDVLLVDINDSTDQTAGVLGTVRTPLGVKCGALLNVGITSNTNSNVGLQVNDPAMPAKAPHGLLAPGLNYHTDDSNLFYWHTGPEVLTNTSSQIAYRSSNAAVDTMIITRGWIDWRGQND